MVVISNKQVGEGEKGGEVNMGVRLRKYLNNRKRTEIVFAMI
jgi:hypothetical protein